MKKGMVQVALKMLFRLRKEKLWIKIASIEDLKRKINVKMRRKLWGQ